MGRHPASIHPDSYTLRSLSSVAGVKNAENKMLGPYGGNGSDTYLSEAAAAPAFMPPLPSPTLLLDTKSQDNNNYNNNSNNNHSSAADLLRLGQGQAFQDHLLQALDQKRCLRSAVLAAPCLKDGADASCISARPGSQRSLLLVGSSKGAVSLWDVVPSTLSTAAGEAAATLQLGNRPVSAACWSPGGSSFAAACEGPDLRGKTASATTQKALAQSAVAKSGRGLGPGAAAPGARSLGSFICIFDLHAGDDPGSACELLELLAVERDWGVEALSFCDNGSRLAVAASAGLYSWVVILDVDSGLEEARLALPRCRLRSLKYAPSPPGSVCCASLIIAADQKLLLWAPQRRPAQSLDAKSGSVSRFSWPWWCRKNNGSGEPACATAIMSYNYNAAATFSQTRHVEVSYTTAVKVTPLQDLRFDGDSMSVFAVSAGGPASLCGVQGGAGWLLLGWKLRKGDGWGPLIVPKENKEAWGILEGSEPMVLVFQAPDCVQSLACATQVRCAAASPDGALLAAGCEKPNTAHAHESDSSNSPPTLIIWSLENQEPWRARAVSIGSVRSISWVSNSTLVVAHDKAVSLVNAETGGVAREWSFFPLQVSSVEAVVGKSWIAVSLDQRSSRNHRVAGQILLFGLDAGGSTTLPIAANAVVGGLATVVAGSDGGKLLALGGSDLGPGIAPRSNSQEGLLPVGLSLSNIDLQSMSPQSRKPTGISMWHFGTTLIEKRSSLGTGAVAKSVALSDDSLLVACFSHRQGEGATLMKAFHAKSGEELCRIEHHDALNCVASSGSADEGIVAAAGQGRYHPPVGVVCWIGKSSAVSPGLERGGIPSILDDKLCCSTQGNEVMSLAFLPGSPNTGENDSRRAVPGGRWLAGGLKDGTVCIWSLTQPGSAKLLRELRTEVQGPVRCLAFVQDGQRSISASAPSRLPMASAKSPPGVGRQSPRAGRNNNIINNNNNKIEAMPYFGHECPPALIACSGTGPRLVVHESRVGLLRNSLDIGAGTEAVFVYGASASARSALKITTLKFAASGRVLFAGDSAGCVHIFGLGHALDPHQPQKQLKHHRILSLGGAISALSLKGDQLMRVMCLRALVVPEAAAGSSSVFEAEAGAGSTPDNQQGAKHHEVLVYDLENPSLEFLLPDLKLGVHDRPEALRAQLEELPRLIHQRLLPGLLGWSLLHLCASRGLARHARLLVGMMASPLSQDAQGRNALDVALDHHEFGVAEDLLAVLTEQARGSFSANQDGQAKTTSIVAAALPAEHLALSRTVVRLLGYGVAGLPDFLDIACCGPARLGSHSLGSVLEEQSSAQTFRAALLSGEMRICTSRAPSFRHGASEFQGLVPRFAETGIAEHPAEVSVSYLRGALDSDIGLVVAMRQANEDILRTKFAHVVLEHKWNTSVKSQFIMDCVVYLVYMAVFFVWCWTGPMGLAEEHAEAPSEVGGVIFQLASAALVVFTAFFIWEEATQLWFEVKRSKENAGNGAVAAFHGASNYFTTWNILDLLRILLVGVAIIWSYSDREAFFSGDGLSLLSFTVLVVWSRLISFLRAFQNTGHLVRTFITIFWDIRMFFVLLALMGCAFASAFGILFQQPLNSTGLEGALWFVFRNAIGEGNSAPEGGDETTLTAKVLMLLLVIVLYLVMTNFLIAIMSDSFDRVQDNAEVARNLMRLELVYEAEVTASAEAAGRAPPRSYIFTCEGVHILDALALGHTTSCGGLELHRGCPVVMVRFANASRSEADQAADKWEGRVKQVEKTVRRESRMTSAALADQGHRLAAIEDRVSGIEANFNQGQARIQEALERLLEMRSP
ncbi:unnamed protein product, partial [Polarella glacialis]